MRKDRFDADFASDADYEDGFVESDAVRGERNAKRAANLQQGPSAANVKADDNKINVNVNFNPQFNFGLPADKKTAEVEKKKDVEIVPGKDGQMQFSGDGFSKAESVPFDKEHLAKAYENISVKDRETMSDKALSDAALAYQEAKEDREMESYYGGTGSGGSASNNQKIAKTMSVGEAVAEKEVESQKQDSVDKDVP